MKNLSGILKNVGIVNMPFFKGYKHSEEVKRKISKANMGRKQKKRGPTSEEQKRKISESLKGRKMSIETKRKLSLVKKGVKNPKVSLSMTGKKRLMTSGKNHWNWKGGMSTESEIIRHGIEFRLWREAVFARDNWTDQKTGIKGGKLHPHHIQNFAQYPELRFAIDNGITLSKEIHQEFHKKYGKRNNTKEQLEEFLKKGMII